MCPSFQGQFCYSRLSVYVLIHTFKYKIADFILYLCSYICLRQEKRGHNSWKHHIIQPEEPDTAILIYLLLSCWVFLTRYTLENHCTPRKFQWNGIIITISMWKNKSYLYEKKLTNDYIFVAYNSVLEVFSKWNLLLIFPKLYIWTVDHYMSQTVVTAGKDMTLE